MIVRVIGVESFSVCVWCERDPNDSVYLSQLDSGLCVFCFVFCPALNPRQDCVAHDLSLSLEWRRRGASPLSFADAVAGCVPPCPSPVSPFADDNKISDAGASALAEALQGSQLGILYLGEYD